MSGMNAEQIDKVINQLNKTDKYAYGGAFASMAIRTIEEDTLPLQNMLHSSNRTYTVYIAPKALSNAAYRSRTSQDWILDSGANVFITSPEDTEIIISTRDKFESVKTANGLKDARMARVKTPIGVQDAPLIDGATRLFPCKEISANGSVKWENNQLEVFFDGQPVDAYVQDGIPMIRNSL